MKIWQSLENYVGQHRPIGTRKNNTSLRDFRFKDNFNRNQKIFWPIAANVCGQDNGMADFTNEALSCCKKSKKVQVTSCHFVRISPILNSSSIKNSYFNSHTLKLPL